MKAWIGEKERRGNERGESIPLFSLSGVLFLSHLLIFLLTCN